MNLEVSGAGKLHVLFVEATDCDLDFSGAASVTIDGNIRNVETDFSGACNVTMTGKYGRLNLDASGAGDIKLKGTAETLAGGCVRCLQHTLKRTELFRRVCQWERCIGNNRQPFQQYIHRYFRCDIFKLPEISKHQDYFCIPWM